MFFFGVKKEPRSLDCSAPPARLRMTCGEFGFSPYPLKPPLAEWGERSTRTTNKRGFVNFGTKPLLFLSSREHKHKTVSSASEFENACSQTLDTLLLFMQLG